MKLEPAKDKFESLYQAFILLFTSPNDRASEEVSRAICMLLMDDEITHQHAQDACSKAMEALVVENTLMNTLKGTTNG